jgi:hypothetical protein
MYDDNELCEMEALDMLRPASDALLALIASGRIDLNRFARLESRARNQREAARWIGAMARFNNL